MYLDRHTHWVVGHLSSYPVQDWYTSMEMSGWAVRHYEDYRAVEDRLAADGQAVDLARLIASLTHTYLYLNRQQAAAAIDRLRRHMEQFAFSRYEQGLLCVAAASAGLPARLPRTIAESSERAVDLLREHGDPEALVVTRENHLAVWTAPDTAHGVLVALLTTK